jgi:RimJ/RimL family protein N-acetyltransferase
MTILKTDRLILRPFGEEDLDHLAFLASPPRTREETQARLQKILDHWHRHGFGVWAVLEQATGQFAGHCGIGYLHELPDVELTYALLPRFRGRGLATEAVIAILRHAFEVVGLPRVLGVAVVDNVASHRVMAKAGMRLQGPYEYDGKQAVMYAIENPSAIR